MSAIRDFAARQAALNDRMDVAVAGLATEIKALNDDLGVLRQSADALSPEDQALLAMLEAKVGNILARLQAFDALDPLAPPAG